MALIWSRREAAFANLRRWLYCKNDQIKVIPFNNHTKHEVILVFKYLPEFFKAFLPQPFALKQSVFSGRLDECKNTVG